MGRFTYYAPLYVGFIVSMLGRDVYVEQVTFGITWLYWFTIIAASLGFALMCQLVFIGIQGFSAQVLPVPFGRSIRGSGARWMGAGLLLAIAGNNVAGLFLWEAMSMVAYIILGVSSAILLSVLIAYLWSLPAAVADFDTRDPLV